MASVCTRGYVPCDWWSTDLPITERREKLEDIKAKVLEIM